MAINIGAEFTAINPLQRIPVAINDGFRIVESLAILDYLEAKYPSPSLMPKDAEAIAAALPHMKKILATR